MHPWVVRGLLAALPGIALGAALSFGPGVSANRDSSAAALAPDDARLLAEVIEHVRREYVDRIDDEALVVPGDRLALGALKLSAGKKRHVLVRAT